MSIADWDPTTQRASAPLAGASGSEFPLEPDSCEDCPEALAEAFKAISKEQADRGAVHDGRRAAARSRSALHRLAAVRRQQGISPRNMARRLNVDVATVLKQEEETTDLPLSTLYAWQQVLEIPVADLLVDDDAPLSAPVYERARMVKVMKTAAAILEKAPSKSVKRLATMLIEQLVEIMPELRDVSAWHTIGQRRTLDDFGRVVERQLPDDFLGRHP